MKPTLAVIILLFWTVLTWQAHRLTASATAPERWRTVIPSLFFILSVTCFNYTFTFFKQKYRHEQGFPRRYYSLDTKD